MKVIKKAFLKTLAICATCISMFSVKAMAIDNRGLSKPFQRFEYDSNGIYDFGLNFVLSNNAQWLKDGNGLWTIDPNNRRDRWTEIRNSDRRGWEHYSTEWLSEWRYNQLYSNGYCEYQYGYDTWRENTFYYHIGNFVQGYDEVPSDRKPPWYDGGTANWYRRPVLMVYRRNKPYPEICETYMMDEGKPTYTENDRLWVNGNNDFKIRTYGYDCYQDNYGENAQIEANIRNLYIGLTNADNPSTWYCNFVGAVDGNNPDGNYRDFLSPWNLGGDRMNYIKPYWRGYYDSNREYYKGYRRNGMGAEMSAKINHMEEVIAYSKLKNKYEVETGWNSTFGYQGKIYNKIKADSVAPTAIEAHAANITPFGYDIIISGVSDNNQSGVNKVAFPTWTSKNGQDDLSPNWINNAIGKNLGNGQWSYHVDFSEHNYESGEYNTDIYLIDNVQNKRIFKSIKVTLAEPKPFNEPLEVTKYTYKEPNKEIYWVKPNDEVNVQIGGYMPSSWGKNIYPSQNTLYIEKSGIDKKEIQQYSRIDISGKKGLEYDKYFEYLSSSLAKKMFWAERNILTSTHKFKPKIGETEFKLYTGTKYEYGSLTNFHQIENIEDSKKVIKVDSIKPSIKGIPSSEWTKNDINLKLDATDIGSGMKKVELYKNDIKIASGSTSLSYLVSDEGINNFKVVAVDNVGNIKEENFVIKIDKTAPNGKLNFSFNENSLILKTQVSDVIETGSGVKEIWAEFTNKDEPSVVKKLTLVLNNNIYINSQNLYNIFGNACTVKVVVKAIDNVGNERVLGSSEQDIFKINANISRILSPHDPIFRKGEKGVLNIDMFGGIQRLKIIFPDELASLSKEVEISPKMKDRYRYEFFVPFEALEKDYKVKVVGIKNNKEKVVYPTLKVKEDILNQIRTRIRK